MKKILITRKLIKESEDKASKTFEPIFNSNDELYSQSKVIEMSKGCEGILSSLTEKIDKDTIINKQSYNWQKNKKANLTGTIDSYHPANNSYKEKIYLDKIIE